MTKPWYRQFWPWFLIALPASAVLAGIATILIATHKPHSLVVDDYYKEGLAINRQLAREQRAATLGLVARLSFDSDRGAVDAVLSARQPPQGERLRLQLFHPTRAEWDQTIPLLRQPDGRYTGVLAEAPPGYWHLVLEPLDGEWRLNGRLQWPRQTTARLEPASAP